MSQPHHIDPATVHGEMRHVVAWHRLLTVADAMTTTDPAVPLALFWGHVRRGNDAAAQFALDELVADTRHTDPDHARRLDDALHDTYPSNRAAFAPTGSLEQDALPIGSAP